MANTRGYSARLETVQMIGDLNRLIERDGGTVRLLPPPAGPRRVIVHFPEHTERVTLAEARQMIADIEKADDAALYRIETRSGSGY